MSTEDQSVVSSDVLARLRVNDEVNAETTDLIGESIDLSTSNVSFRETEFNLYV